MPLQATSGAASYDAFGGGVPAVTNYIEDVFSTWLYTGNGSTQTITNGIDLSGKGGLVWIKNRNTQDFGSTRNHWLFDSARTAGYSLSTNSTSAQNSAFAGSIPFNSTGFSINTGDDNLNGVTTISGPAYTYASWSFAKAPKFFDVVTWTGTGVDGQVIPHSLGVKPSVIIVKRTDTTSDWQYNDANDNYLLLNTTAASAGANRNGGWIPQYNTTATTLTTQNYSGNSNVNASGGTYVAYLFAHNAGGFGLTGTDNVISCGSYTTSSVGKATVDLGYEPQWLLVKRSSGTGSWYLADNMRGWSLTQGNVLSPNTSAAEADAWGGSLFPTATGFQDNGVIANSSTVIYIAIRRGPMKVPTSGTSVYNAIARTGTGATATVTGVGFAPDAVWGRRKDANYGRNFDRLRGVNTSLAFAATANEASPSDSLTSYNMDGFSVGADPSEHINASSIPYIYWNFKRAPSFMDEVCYTGTGSATTITHNLAAVPELMIVKRRSYVSPAVGWNVYSSSLANSEYLVFNSTAAKDTGTDRWNSTTPTSSVFSVGTSTTTNASAGTYIAYLFATCAGVSKVGSYTGTGTTLQVDCGFTGGARFVLLKATSTTGNWMVYDTARGMTTLTDPFLSLNSTSAETATLGACTTVSTGFAVNESILAGVNTNGVSFVYLAIA